MFHCFLKKTVLNCDNEVGSSNIEILKKKTMGLTSYEKKELLEKGLNLKLKNLKFNSYSSDKEVPIVKN